VPFDFDAAEQHLLAGADEDLAALEFARRILNVLAVLVEDVTIPNAPENAPPSFHVLSATVLLSVMALRTARACLLVVSAGYMPESAGLMRRLSEIHARVQAVAADRTGQHARDWLNGKGPSTPHKIVGKFGDARSWDLFSMSTHADADGVRLFSRPPEAHKEDHSGQIHMTPQRDARISNALVIGIAAECGGIAHALADCRAWRDQDVAIRRAVFDKFVVDLNEHLQPYRVPHPANAGE
jgi:hypothetical protein